MRPLEPGFAGRVRETTVLVGGLLFLALLPQADWRLPLCFLVGVGLSLLVWAGAQALVTRLDGPPRRLREVWPLVGWYLGKYAVALVALAWLAGGGLLEPFSFVGGFVVPTVVVLAKALTLSALPAELAAAPIYSSDRKAAAGE